MVLLFHFLLCSGPWLKGSWCWSCHSGFWVWFLWSFFFQSRQLRQDWVLHCSLMVVLWFPSDLLCLINVQKRYMKFDLSFLWSGVIKFTICFQYARLMMLCLASADFFSSCNVFFFFFVSGVWCLLLNMTFLNITEVNMGAVLTCTQDIMQYLRLFYRLILWKFQQTC